MISSDVRRGRLSCVALGSNAHSEGQGTHMTWRPISLDAREWLILHSRDANHSYWRTVENCLNAEILRPVRSNIPAVSALLSVARCFAEDKLRVKIVRLDADQPDADLLTIFLKDLVPVFGRWEPRGLRQGLQHGVSTILPDRRRLPRVRTVHAGAHYPPLGRHFRAGPFDLAIARHRRKWQT
jgi:hypothetical protein